METEDDIIKKVQIELYKKYIATFNSYLAKRMEFLADFISGVPQLQTTSFFINDIIKPFDENRILLNRISGLSNQNYKFKINVILPENKKDVKVAVSNDVLGRQAIYIILENIIRNTAKHSLKNNKKKIITFTIKIDEPTYAKSYYKVIIYDDIELSSSYTIDKKLEDYTDKNIIHWLNTYKKLDQTEISNAKRIVLELNALIDSQIINEQDFELRKTGLGMIEMLVSAAYLRRIPVQNVQNKKYRLCFDADTNKCPNKDTPKIFRAVVVQNKYLGYQFYLPKPKEVLFIDPDQKICKNFKTDEWKNNGLTYINNPEKELTYVHNICVINADSIDKKYNNLNLPYRKVLWKDVLNCYEKKNTNGGLDLKIDNVQTIFVAIWCAYVSDIYSKKGLKDYDNFLCSNSGETYSYSFSDHAENYNPCHRDVLQSYTEITDSKTRFIESEIVIDNILYLKFLNAMITNILILDERIQTESTTKYSIKGNEYTPPTYQKLWDNINVYIPTGEELNLNAENYNYADYIRSIQDIIKDQFINHDKRKSKGIDFIVIHLGVIEKLIIVNPKYMRIKSDTNVSIVINEITKDFNNVRVIITSGRGQPENLPDDILFVSYTMLAQYLIHKRFKLFLSELLYAAKPLKNK